MDGIRKTFFFLFLLAIFALGIIEAFGTTESPGSPDETISFGNQQVKNTPQIVSARILQDSFISGKEGYFSIELFIKSTDKATGKKYFWDIDAPPPVLWISASSESGIHFQKDAATGRPDQQTLIKFEAPTSATETYTAQVKYFVESRASAEHSYLWLDTVTSVKAADGTVLEDAGEILIPIIVDTPLQKKILVLVVIAIVVFLFITEWVRVDVVAIMVMVALPELGLLDPRFTFRGLSSNAVIAIIGVMIISFALNRADLVSKMIRPVLNYVGKSTSRMMIIFSTMIAVISSVMQNTGAAVLFLPAIRNTCNKILHVPVSRVLMPIGMAAILGGTLTMIGTSPLILLNDLLPPGMDKFSLFELTPIGIALVTGGIGFFLIAGKHLLPETHNQEGEHYSNSPVPANPHLLEEYNELDGPFELYVPQDYTLGGGPQKIDEIRCEYMVNIVAFASSSGRVQTTPAPQSVINSGMGLCVFGPIANIEKFAADYGLILRKEPVLLKDHFNPAVSGTVEIVISPRSTLLGKTIEDVRFRTTFGINDLALHQNGKTYYHEMPDIPFQAGDAVLVHGTWEQILALKDLNHNFIITSPIESEIKKPAKATAAFICFSATLILMMFSSFYFQNKAYNPIPLSICLMTGALGMILTGVLTINEAYRAVDWRTIFLLGGLLPLGMAVDRTGTAEWVATGLISLIGNHLTPLVVMTLLALLSGAFTLVISNVGACTLLVPLGISIANQIGMDPRIAAVVVGIGVSNSFILPTHQVNALYMGPGNYRTMDYIKFGGVLSFLYVVILVTVTYFFYFL